MQFAIPHAPRKVRLGQVPGAAVRLGLFVILSLAVAGVFTAAIRLGVNALSAEHARERRSELVMGTFVEAKLPPKDQREDHLGAMTVLYDYRGRRYSADNVAVPALKAEGWGPGAQVKLEVDPLAPDRPFDPDVLTEKVARASYLPLAVGLGALMGLGLFALLFFRLYSQEIDPLRHGAIVWLTPDEALPESTRDVRFRAHYFRQDVKHEVIARGRPGRAPVRNGDKVLAALVPRKPSWVRLVDFDLAKALGWLRDYNG